MKTILVVLLALSPAAALAQDAHVVAQHRSYGGFGGPVVRFTEMNGQFGMMAGGHGGWVIGRWLSLGAGGYALVGTGTNLTGSFAAGSQPWLSFTYGGFEVQYLNRPEHRAHVTLSATAGAGKAVSHVGSITQDDGVFVVEPAIALTRHITRAIHIEVGASYRFVSGVDLPGATNAGLSGLSGLIGVDFGHF